MSSIKSVSKKSYAFKMMAALAVSSSIFAGFSAFADEALTNAIELNPTFRVHSAPETNAPSNGTISKSEIVSAEQLKHEGTSAATWVKIVRADGSAGFVRGGTVHKVVLGDNYIVHENPSLSGKRVGTVAQISKATPLVLTGKNKIVSENGKKINWLEVLHNGKAAWVASDSVKSVDAERSASTPIDAKKVTAKKPKAVAKVDPAAPKKWGAPANPPVPPIHSTDMKIADPSVKQEKLVAVQVPDKLTPPPKKDAKPAAQKESAPKIASIKAPVADLTCVKTIEEFKASAVMQKAYGPKYNPFVEWTGDGGPDVGKLKFTPLNDADGNWVLDSLDSPGGSVRHIPAQICVDNGGKHHFVSALGQQVDLKNKDQITITAEGSTVTFNRTVK